MRLVVGDKCAGMLGALEEVFPGARYQRCTVHFYRNVLGRVPVTRRKAVARMLKAIYAKESRGVCGGKAGGGGRAGVDAVRSGREDGARRVRRDAYLHGIPAGALAPDQDEQRGRVHRPRDQEEDQGRRDLPGRQLGPHAVTARLKYIVEHERGKRRCLDMSKLEEMDELKEKAEG